MDVNPFEKEKKCVNCVNYYVVFFVQLLLYVFCIPTEGEVSKMSNF